MLPLFCSLISSLVLCSYPGVLMSEELLDKFNGLWHCPTVLRLQQLDYWEGATVPDCMATQSAKAAKSSVRRPSHLGGAAAAHSNDEKRVEISLVGLPHELGSIINDGKHSNRTGQLLTNAQHTECRQII